MPSRRKERDAGWAAKEKEAAEQGSMAMEGAPGGKLPESTHPRTGPHWAASLRVATNASSSSCCFSPAGSNTDSGGSGFWSGLDNELEEKGWLGRREATAGGRRRRRHKTSHQPDSYPAAAWGDKQVTVSMVTYRQAGKGEIVLARASFFDEEAPAPTPILLDRLGGCDDVCVILSDGSDHHLAGSTVLSLPNILFGTPSPVEVEVGAWPWRIKCRMERRCQQQPRAQASNWSVLAQPIVEGHRDGIGSVALVAMALFMVDSHSSPYLRLSLLGLAAFILLASYLERQALFDPDDTLWSWDLYIIGIERSSKAQGREASREEKRRRRSRRRWSSLTSSLLTSMEQSSVGDDSEDRGTGPSCEGHASPRQEGMVTTEASRVEAKKDHVKRREKAGKRPRNASLKRLAASGTPEPAASR